MLIAATALMFAALATATHLATILLVATRYANGRRQRSATRQAAGVTLVRPIRDCDAIEERTLRSSFQLEHPNFEILFCAASEQDAAVPIVRRLIIQHPNVPARLLIGENRISSNAKLNNMVKGWDAAAFDWIVFADSNLILPSDYLDRVTDAWRPDTGAVCAPPVGSEPANFWAEVECAFLNGYQARWQYAADGVGYGFAQGKTMHFKRSILDRCGGLHALAVEPAEDAATTKAVRAHGLRVRLAEPGFCQPLGKRTAEQVLARQARWALLRRKTFPALFGLEVLTGSIAPAAAIAIAASHFDWPVAAVVSGHLAVWLGSEAGLVLWAGWHFSWRSPLAWLVRDLLLPIIWLKGWLSSTYAWRGDVVVIQRSGGTVEAAAPRQ